MHHKCNVVSCRTRIQRNLPNIERPGMFALLSFCAHYSQPPIAAIQRTLGLRSCTNYKSSVHTYIYASKQINVASISFKLIEQSVSVKLLNFNHFKRYSPKWFNCKAQPADSSRRSQRSYSRAILCYRIFGRS